MSENFSRALNAFTLGKHDILETTIVTLKVIKETIREFEEKHKTRYHF